MNKAKFLLLFLFMQVNHLNSQLAIGSIEEFFIEHNAYDRRIQIYYPFNNQIDKNTKFVIMNDAEELFLEEDAWRGRSWRIDKTFKDLAKTNKNLNIVVIAVNSAKKPGKILNSTRRYADYFPNESIVYFKDGLKKSIYSAFIDQENLNYPKFLASSLIPELENKLKIKLNKNNLGVIGSSMGGLSALNTVLEYPELFGFAGCLSIHWIGIKPFEYLTLPLRKKISADEDTVNAIKRYVEINIHKLNDHKIYFDHGTRGLDYLYRDPQININKAFEENNILFKSEVYKGHEHDPVDFGKRFKSIILYMLES
jgi:predicted alpha/beta superfamily hydrolase